MARVVSKSIAIIGEGETEWFFPVEIQIKMDLDLLVKHLYSL